MFSYVRFVYRRIIILILVYYYSLIGRVRAYYESFTNECRPIRSNEELLAFWRSPFNWYNLAQPLTQRSSPQQLNNDFLNIRQQKPHHIEDEATRPKVLVCHDLAGNYREDRFINGSKKWNDYRFYHWAGIDYFCYFSHNYITIPPLPWINAAHRHGVPILGTYIVESSRLLNEVLESETQMLRIVECLVKVTQCCCFDGWLMNIECSINSEKIPLLRRFVERLTERIHEELPDGKIFWYDSIIESGRLLWQNELNVKNIDFFNVSDGILLNYNWSNVNLMNTAEIITQDPVLMAKVFVGIDVFGRNQTGKFHSHETLRKIKQFNFSVGIFAPAWTFEAISDIGLNPFDTCCTHTINHHFMRRNHLFWTLLWNYFYSSGPSTLPFYTSFCLGSGRMKFQDGILTQSEPWFNIMEQEYQPSVPSVYEYHFGDAFRGGSCLRFRGNVNKLRLFVSEFRCEQDFVISYVFKHSSSRIRINLILKIVDGNNTNTGHLIVHCGNDSEASSASGEKHILPINYNALERVAVGLSERQERILPTHRPINEWHSRYFYLKFDRDVKSSRIVDVGISVVKDGGWTEDDFLQLGAVHIHAGISDDEHIAISNDSQINIHDFAQVRREK